MDAKQWMPNNGRQHIDANTMDANDAGCVEFGCNVCLNKYLVEYERPIFWILRYLAS